MLEGAVEHLGLAQPLGERSFGFLRFVIQKAGQDEGQDQHT